MKLCEYGCGREGKYILHFKCQDDKRCCEKSWHKCPSVRMKINKKIKGIKRSDHTKRLLKERAKTRYENIEERELQSKRMKKIWENQKLRDNLSIKAKKRYSDSDFKIRHSNSLKEAYKRPEVLIKIRRSIEKIKKKWPIFYKEEEMRYNPDKSNEKEIQVHCKNHNCENSKEKGGWFTPTSRQIELRISCIESENGNGGGYFYCSQKCKEECVLFNSRGNDPFELSRFERYKKEVIRLTEISVKNNFDKIKNINIRSRDFPLDHKYSIYDGFINNVDERIISHWKNLQIVPVSYNASKQENSSISLDKLKKQIGMK